MLDGKLIHLTQGYSRDHRADLNQVVLNMIVESQAGIVLHMQGLDGNMSDKTAFCQTITSHIQQLQTVQDLDCIVMDSAGYTKESLIACGTSLKWIGRVPETLTESKAALAKSYDNWSFLAEGYQYVALQSDYAGIAQRWLLVFSAAAYQREMITLRKKYQKESSRAYQDFDKLSKLAFGCQHDAQKAFDTFSLSCKYLTVSDLIITKVAYFAKKGRPKKEEVPTGYHYFITAKVCCSLDTFEKMAQTKGKFILANNDRPK